MSYPWTDHIDHDAFDELDLSGSGGKSGAIGCMARWLEVLHQREIRLHAEFEAVQQSKAIALEALDRFVAEGRPGHEFYRPHP